MKQIAQRLRDGGVDVLEVPIPSLGEGAILVDVRASLLSAGTERAKVEIGKKGLLGKARSRPDDVRQVVAKARRDGVRATAEAVRIRLDQLNPLGYSSAGIVRAIGPRVRGITIGDRVACAGGGYAVHADVNAVPANLCVPVPNGVPFEHAAFATVGAVAMHGVRQADARLGERVAVIGLGLIGQLSGQIMRAAGCTVVGIDLEQSLVNLALESGAADTAYVRDALDDVFPAEVLDCDAVLLTAATTSNDPVELAARLCRDRGRVVVVGDVGIDVPRAPYYDKELDIRFSRSYGPGRYDRQYEENGLDYPIAYVRWTERRNMGAVLDLIAGQRIDVEPLITQRVTIDDAPRAYADLVGQARSPLGIVLQYGESLPAPPSPSVERNLDTSLSAGVIGAGSFSQRVLIPSLRDAGFALTAIASAGGLSARSAGDRFQFRRTESVDGLLASSDVDIVVVASTHASHADYALAALLAGKDVFVEKPPALTYEQLDRLRFGLAGTGRLLRVGFNRRFAPLALELREAVIGDRAESAEVLYRINAGPLAPDHWVNDIREGGGRLLGEGCHFVDFACWLLGDLPISVSATLGPVRDAAAASAGSFVISLAFTNGSVASILYGSSGSSRAGKEYVEVHSRGRSGVLDDFGALVVTDASGRSRSRTGTRDKGHRAQLREFASLLQGNAVSDELSPLDTMQVTLAALESGLTGRAINPSAGPLEA